ncbi:MAG: hypothetical protein R3242_01225 [Akkermansiaceae bacterium]|nr:hypothetical protein [Akkermansiaceae bacterium]
MSYIKLTILSTLLLLPSCKKGLVERAEDEFEQSELRHETLDALDRTTVPYLGDFLRLYPKATVRYLSFGDAEFPSFSATTTLYDRYEFNLRIPVFYSEDNKAVTGFGEPLLHFMEVRSVTEQDGVVTKNAGELQKSFSETEWEALVAADGDFSELGLELIEDRPVPNFDLVKDLLRKTERVIPNTGER